MARLKKPDVNNHTKAIEWAKEVLKETELYAEVIVETPWSNVLKIDMSQGSLYLKQTPPDLFIEVDIIQTCRQLCAINDIPEIVAVNQILHCFLMMECGNASLRTMFDGRINVDLLVQGLEVYKKMQLATIPHIDALIKAGVPDWRLQRFTKLYQELISNNNFLQTNGLTTTQIKILRSLVRKVEMLCEELSKYNIPECFNHSDFNENNILYNNATHKISIIDLGETAINHPFFSLAAFLKIPCNIYNMVVTSTDYKKLYDNCFDGWLGDKKSTIRAIGIINILLPIYLLFAQKRFLDAIDLPYNIYDPISVKQHDKIKKGFLWFLDNLQAEI